MALVVSTTSKVSSGFDPRTIPDCALWLDAADRNTMSLTGSNINSWSDKVSNVSFAASSTKPTIYNSTYNGINPVYFGGSAYLSNGTFSYQLSNRSAFIVCGELSKVGGAGLMSFASGGNDYNQTNTMAYETAGSSESAYLQIISAFDKGGFYVRVGTATTMPFGLYGDTFSSGTETAYENGTQRATATASATFSNSTGLVLGGRYFGGSTSGSLNGVIAEIVLFNRALATSERQQLEGYLARKWGLSSNLPATHLYRSIPIVTRPFQPIDITGCALWLDAADATTLTLSGSNVTTWADKSGTGRNATAAVAAAFNSTGRYLNFVGSNYYTIPNASFAVNDYYTFFFVERLQVSGGTRIFMGTDSAGPTNAAPHIGYTTTSSSNITFAQYGNDVNATVTAFSSASAQPVRIWSLTFRNSFRGIYLNGTLLASDTNNTKATAWPNPLICRTFGGGYYYGFLYEIIAYGGEVSASQRQQVEAYLAAKWGLRTNLPSTHPFKLVPAITPAFTPLQISGCALWLDAADRTTLTLSGSNVTQWNDKSGNSNNATQSTVSNAPALSGSNITFNGSQWFTTPVSSAPTTESLFIVLNTTSNSTTDIFSGTAVGYREVLLYLSNLYVGRFGAAPTGTNGGPIATNTRLQFNYQYTTTNVTYSVNGTQTGSGTPGFTYSGTNTTYIGSSTYSPNNYVGTINEIVYYTAALTTAQRQQVEGYLAAKWGLKSSLPTTHPFKVITP
jgi:hypothetical protein